MSLQLVQPTRSVQYGAVVRDQFAAFAVDGYTKTSGLNPSTQMVVTAYRDGAVVGSPPTITIAEISTLGEYSLTFTPNQIGVWVIEVQIVSLSLTWKGQYEVSAVTLAGQTFYGNVRDEHGNGVPWILVEVLLAGTATVVTTTKTAFDGSYSVPLTGTLAANPLLDLRFSGNLIQTFLQAGVRLA
jgi:hypothetical protein